MKSFTTKGGEKASKGTYWNIANGERVDAEQGQVLPGNAKATYLKGHPVVILLTAPILGLVYAGFLPFIGIAAVVAMLGHKLIGGVGHEVSRVTSFGWRPVEAYLAGRKNRKAQKDAKSVKKE